MRTLRRRSSMPSNMSFKDMLFSSSNQHRTGEKNQKHKEQQQQQEGKKNNNNNKKTLSRKSSWSKDLMGISGRGSETQNSSPMSRKGSLSASLNMPLSRTRSMPKNRHKNKNNKNSNQRLPLEVQPESSFSNVDPQIYLDDLMHSRGYPIQKVETLDSESYVISSPKQRPSGYASTQLLDLAREGNDKELIRTVKKNGTLCLFQYASSRGDDGETLIHIICRYCRKPDTLRIFLEETGVDIRVADEYGRTPLHYACWRGDKDSSNLEPCFQMIDDIMTSREMVNMFLYSDIHGSVPLSYVPRHHWGKWIQYLSSKKDIWFKPKKTNDTTGPDGIRTVQYYTPKITEKVPITIDAPIRKGPVKKVNDSNHSAIWDDDVSRLSCVDFEDDDDTVISVPPVSPPYKENHKANENCSKNGKTLCNDSHHTTTLKEGMIVQLPAKVSPAARIA